MTTRLRLASPVALDNSVVVATVPTSALGDASAPGWRARRSRRAGHAALGRSVVVGVYVPELKAGASLELDLLPGDEDDLARGIKLDDQPENGRIVVNYSGLLQTIYHYGAELFKPRFYPVNAPCGRLGDMEGPGRRLPEEHHR